MNKKARVNECGHTDKPYYAKGKCKSCYNLSYITTPESKAKKVAYNKAYDAKPENRDRRLAYQRAYYSKPENRDRKVIDGRIHHTKPENKAKAYCRRTQTSYEETLLWFLIPVENRCCWLCGVMGDAQELDHNHETLVIRGWAHHHCNVAEGAVMKAPDPIRLLAVLAARFGNDNS